MGVTSILHLDGDGFPLCARTRRRGHAASEWLKAHVCHVQGTALDHELPLVNQYVNQGVARLPELCKGQSPGQRCCDPESIISWTILQTFSLSEMSINIQRD
jgi:hypothetical protein